MLNINNFIFFFYKKVRSKFIYQVELTTFIKECNHQMIEQTKTNLPTIIKINKKNVKGLINDY